MLGGSLVGLVLPLLCGQILWINLLTPPAGWGRLRDRNLASPKNMRRSGTNPGGVDLHSSSRGWAWQWQRCTLTVTALAVGASPRVVPRTAGQQLVTLGLRPAGGRARSAFEPRAGMAGTEGARRGVLGQ